MALVFNYDSVFERADTWDTEERCIFFDGIATETLNFVYISCKCEKRLKPESHDDYFIPLSDPRSAKCGDPVCRKKGTLKCMFCDEVYCRACIKTHCIFKRHNAKIRTYLMPYPATEKIIFPCYNCKLDDKCAEYYCTQHSNFVCSTCKFRFHSGHNCKVIIYIGNEMKLIFQSSIIWNGTDNDTDQYTSTNPNENCDSGRVPIPKSTRFMDYIPATTSTNRKVLIKNRGKYYPPPPSAAEIDPIIVCACCGRKAETSVKCFSCKRSYHRRCHIPSLPEETTDDAPMAKWKCTMCINITKLKSANTPDENRHRHAGSFSLSPIKKKIAERILMELYCRGHDSQHYEECPDRQKNPQYYQIIARPISLNDVRNHLNSDMYTSFGGIVEDLNMVFSNGLLYYWPGDARRNAAMNLQDSLRRMLREWMPASKRSK